MLCQAIRDNAAGQGTESGIMSCPVLQKNLPGVEIDAEGYWHSAAGIFLRQVIPAS